SNLITPPEQVWVAKHFANPSHTVSGEKRKRVSAVPMNVHVPETGDQELAAGIDYFPTLRDSYFASFSEISNVGAGDDNSHIRLRRPAGNIDDREVSQDESFLFRIRPPAGEEQGRQQEKRGNDFYHV